MPICQSLFHFNGSNFSVWQKFRILSEAVAENLIGQSNLKFNGSNFSIWPFFPKARGSKMPICQSLFHFNGSNFSVWQKFRILSEAEAENLIWQSNFKFNGSNFSIWPFFPKARGSKMPICQSLF